MATWLEGHRPPFSGCSNLYRVVLCRFKDPGLYPVCKGLCRGRAEKDGALAIYRQRQ